MDKKLKHLLLNKDWKLFEDYLAGEREQLVTRLCKCKEEQLKDLQGRIGMIDQILKLKPQTESGSPQATLTL